MRDPGPPLPLQAPAAPAQSRVYAMYERSYRRRPAKAAAKLVWLGEQAGAARARGDQKTADQYDEARAALEALLSHLGRCRRCGRALSDPESLRRGVGPECTRKAS